jgi:hypothetical protein
VEGLRLPFLNNLTEVFLIAGYNKSKIFMIKTMKNLKD